MLTRSKNPMRRGGSLQRRTTLRSTTWSRQTAGLVPSPFKKKGKKRRPMAERRFALACRGEPCYLLIPGAPSHDKDTVVDCHSNQQAHGKGMGIKADDEKTVPGCGWCHHAIDQGNWLTKEQRRDYWDDAYARWVPARTAKLAREGES
ncbi:nuclease domain-containing protein [Cupriavidus sp. IK-TO18]|uniref:nuclease domain-containing protein n=1 Tax=Cupriavidus sp. IK-TO18 TaxID=2782182 RepID=UPI00210806CA|nr:nuclease domain-containing protein [Cupriavidus sp. IK-TO18]